MFVKQRMTANPFTTTPGTTIPDARLLMESKGVRHLPVVEGGKVVGVISKNDIRAALPSEATTLSAAEATYLVSRLKVAKVMSKPALTITSEALLEEAAVVLRDNKIEMLPVVDGDGLVGVITESDILDSFIDVLGFREHGTRLTIEAKDEPGGLSILTGITAAHHANIQHLAVHRGNIATSIVVVGLNTLNTDDIERDLIAAGMRIVGKLVNRS